MYKIYSEVLYRTAMYYCTLYYYSTELGASIDTVLPCCSMIQQCCSTADGRSPRRTSVWKVYYVPGSTLVIAVPRIWPLQMLPTYIAHRGIQRVLRV